MAPRLTGLGHTGTESEHQFVEAEAFVGGWREVNPLGIVAGMNLKPPWGGAGTKKKPLPHGRKRLVSDGQAFQ